MWLRKPLPLCTPPQRRNVRIVVLIRGGLLRVLMLLRSETRQPHGAGAGWWVARFRAAATAKEPPPRGSAPCWGEPPGAEAGGLATSYGASPRRLVTPPAWEPGPDGHHCPCAPLGPVMWIQSSKQGMSRNKQHHSARQKKNSGAKEIKSKRGHERHDPRI